MSNFDPSLTDSVICTDKKLIHLADGVRTAKEEPVDPEDEDYTQYTLDEIKDLIPELINGTVSNYIYRNMTSATDIEPVSVYTTAEEIAVPNGNIYVKNFLYPNAVSFRVNKTEGLRQDFESYTLYSEEDYQPYYYAPNLTYVHCYVDPDTGDYVWDAPSDADSDEQLCNVFYRINGNCKYNLSSLKAARNISFKTSSVVDSVIPFSNIKTVCLPNLEAVYRWCFVGADNLVSLYLPNFKMDINREGTYGYGGWVTIFKDLPDLKNVYLPNFYYTYFNWRFSSFYNCPQLEELCLPSFSSHNSANGMDTRMIPGLYTCGTGDDSQHTGLKRLILPGPYLKCSGSTFDTSKAFLRLRTHFMDEYDPDEDPTEYGIFVPQEVLNEYKSGAGTIYSNGWKALFDNETESYVCHIIDKVFKPIESLGAGYLDKYQSNRTYAQFKHDFNIPDSDDPVIGNLTDEQINEIFHT